ncbi:unnamed protein product [Rotaria sp. Silwood2]|nr:unnamed protein product [Rotaria sp. Silwood2]
MNVIASSYVLLDRIEIFSRGSYANERIVVFPTSTDLPVTNDKEDEEEREEEWHILRSETIGAIGDVDGSNNEDGDGILYVVDNDEDDTGMETSAPA